MTISEAFGLPKHTVSFSLFASVGEIPSIVVEHYAVDDSGRIMLAEGAVQKIETAFVLIPKEIFNGLPAAVQALIRERMDI